MIGLGPAATRFSIGERVGVAWLGGTCGPAGSACAARRTCASSPTFTGWDRDGGYAELLTSTRTSPTGCPRRSATRRRRRCSAPGIIGYRALRRGRAAAPAAGWASTASAARAHLAAQIALHRGAARARHDPVGAGAAVWPWSWAPTLSATPTDAPPEPLDAAILFAPAGDLVPAALRALDRGGTLAVAGIHLSDIPSLHYAAELFEERQLRSVTANTRADGEEFFRIAAEIPLRPTTVAYPFTAADRALQDLAGGPHHRRGGAAHGGALTAAAVELAGNVPGSPDPQASGELPHLSRWRRAPRTRSGAARGRLVQRGWG